MKKVFITGGAGFIGSYVAHKFLENGYKVHIYDVFKQFLIPDPNIKPLHLLTRLADIYDDIEIIRGDTLNKDFLRRSLTRIKPDIVVHMAALPLASTAIEHTEEAFKSILSSTINILEVIRDFTHSCTMVYISSSMVYGDFETETVDETANKDPKDIYGAFKLSGEIITNAYRKLYGIDARVIRPSAVYGPFDANQRVLYKLITRALKGDELQIDGDGSSLLDFTYVRDTASGIFLVATHPNGKEETFNVTRGGARSLKDAVDIIQTHIPEVRVTSRPTPAYMSKRGTLSVDKARDLLGYKPEWDLEQGIEEYVNHLKKNPI